MPTRPAAIEALEAEDFRGTGPEIALAPPADAADGPALLRDADAQLLTAATVTDTGGTRGRADTPGPGGLSDDGDDDDDEGTSFPVRANRALALPGAADGRCGDASATEMEDAAAALAAARMDDDSAREDDHAPGARTCEAGNAAEGRRLVPVGAAVPVAAPAR